MAYTRIHGIKTTLNKALAYIESPTKTDYQMLVSGYNVDPLFASVEYEMTASLSREIKGDYTKTGGANNLAYHMIQSFAPFDKISPEQAHELGKKWADEILEGKYEYVISTHVDKGHIHNHVIFNAVSFYDYKKFNNYKVAGKLREVSDRLCKEKGLYVIKNPKLDSKSPSQFEFQHRKVGTSWKAQIQNIIDMAISKTDNYDDFKKVLSDMNVEIKEGKRISFRIVGRGQERFCRGDRIGEAYSREGILKRLAEPKQIPAKDEKESSIIQKQTSYPAVISTPAQYVDHIDWKAHRAKVEDTKALAAALLTIRQENISSESDFDLKVNELQEKATSVKATMKLLVEKNHQYKETAKYLLAFNQYLLIKQEAQSVLAPFAKKRFLAEHESEIQAFDHAVAQLEKLGVNTNVDPEKVITLVKDQDNKISELSKYLKEVSARISSIKNAHTLVNSLGPDLDQGQDLKQDIKKDSGRNEQEI